MCRRNLNAAHKLELQFANKDELLAVGREVMSEKGKQGRAKQLGGVSVSDIPQDETPTTREKIAAAAGVATGTVAMAAVIQAEANKKRSVAAKDKERKPDGTFQPVVEQSVPPLGKAHKERKAKAEKSKTNAGAVSRGDKLAKERPDLADKARGGTIGTEGGTTPVRKRSPLVGHFRRLCIRWSISFG
jgi:hypothetical protein